MEEIKKPEMIVKLGPSGVPMVGVVTAGARKTELEKLTEVMDKQTRGWSWDNYTDENGKFFSVRGALYCRLSWVLDYLTSGAGNMTEDARADMEEYANIISEVMEVIEALPDTPLDIDTEAEERAEEIIQNISEDSSLCVIREALEDYFRKGARNG